MKKKKKNTIALYRVVSHTFTCGTRLLFDQATLTCQDIDKVDCALSPTFFYLNDPALRPGIHTFLLSTFLSIFLDMLL